MWAFVGALFSGLWNAIAGYFTGRAQAADEQTLGQKEQAVVDTDAAIKEVQTASAAGDRAAAAVDDPGKLRQFESTDPNNRDRP